MAIVYANAPCGREGEIAAQANILKRVGLFVARHIVFDHPAAAEEILAGREHQTDSDISVGCDLLLILQSELHAEVAHLQFLTEQGGVSSVGVDIHLVVVGAEEVGEVEAGRESVDDIIGGPDVELVDASRSLLGVGSIVDF